MNVWETFTNQEQWRAYLQNLLRTNQKALFRAILLIYERQTYEEKMKGQSVEENDEGFTKIDAECLGKIAQRLIAGDTLTDGEIAKAKNKMPKYWKQLMRISKAKMKREQELMEQKVFEEQQKFRNASFEDEMQTCLFEGKSCSYGICDECPLLRKEM